VPEFDAKADTPTTTVSAGDKFPFGDVSADGWDTITAADLLAALVAVHPDAGGDDTLFLNGSGGFTTPAGGGGGGGAPTTASYLTLGANGTLTAERVLTAGSNITLTDGGAGSTLTVAVDDTPVFAGLVTAPQMAVVNGGGYGFSVTPGDATSYWYVTNTGAGGTLAWATSAKGTLQVRSSNFGSAPQATCEWEVVGTAEHGFRINAPASYTGDSYVLYVNGARVYGVAGSGAVTAASLNGVTVANGGSGALTVTGTASVSGTNTGDQSTFGTIAVSGQSDVVADAAGDTLTLVAGSGISITTDASTDKVTITATGGGGGGGGAAAPRPDPALDLAAADPLLPTAADLLADDTFAIVTADGSVKRVRADAVYSRLKTGLADDLLDLRPHALYWPDLNALYTTAAQTTKTIASNSAAFPGQNQNVYSWADSSGNGRHITNQVVAEGRLTVDFTDTGLPAVQTGNNFTLGRAGESALFGSPWTAVLAVSQDAAQSSHAQVAFAVGKAGTNDYVYLDLRRTDTGGLTGSNVTHRFGGSVSGGWGGTLDDANVADPGRGVQIHAVGWDGASFWFRKQDGTILTAAGTFAGADQFSIGWVYRTAYGFYMPGHAVALALFSRSLLAPDLARVVSEFKRRLLAPSRLDERVTFAARLAGPAGSKTRGVIRPAGAVAATVGTVAVPATVPAGRSGPGVAVSGGSAVKVGRAAFGKFAAWPARGSWFAVFHGKVSALPGSGDAHLMGQWSPGLTNLTYGRAWRVVLTSAGAVRFDVMTTPITPAVQSVTDSAGLTPGDEVRIVAQWDRDAQTLRLNVNGRSQVTAAYAGPDWSINYAEPWNPVTVGAGWSGTGTNPYDAAFSGEVYGVEAGRGTLNTAELALYLAAGGYESARTAGPSVRVTNGRNRHVRWGGPGTPTAAVTVEGEYTAPASGGAVMYTLNGGAAAVGVASPSGRTFSFAVPDVPAGRNVIEVYFAGQPSVRTAVRVNVGPVILVAGQSLAPLTSAYPQRYDGPDGYVTYTDPSRRWRQAGTVEITPGSQDACDLSSLSAGYSAWGRIAARTAARLGVPVGVVIASQSGTDSQSWAPATSPLDDTTLFGQACRMALAAGGADLVWWDQGQNDAAYSVNQSQHTTRLTAVVDGFYAQLGCDTAVVVMPESTAAWAANVAAIQAAQRAVIAAHAHAVPGSDEDGLTPAGDGVHWGSSADPRAAQAEIDARVERHAAALAALGL